MKFAELVRLPEHNGFRVVKEKGWVRYYASGPFRPKLRVN